MFDRLTDRLGTALRRLQGNSRLSEDNMAEALKEVRTALLSADVHFRVAREFIERVQKECAGQKVIESVTPGQMIVKIIHDELEQLLGAGSAVFASDQPLRILMVGLHGSGKTTTSAKLARWLTKRGYSPCLVACDVYRPAAIDQLEQLARQESVAFYGDRQSRDVLSIAAAGLKSSPAGASSAYIFDTAGRLQIDTGLIDEIKRLRDQVQPHEVLLVADSALGQEAVNVARTFHEAVQLTGIVLTKLDGDARGGAALSMKAITQVPIKFMGTGEKIADFELFHADRMASRILGMGDVVSLVEKAQEAIDQKEAVRLADKMAKAEFDLEDFLAQLRQMKKLGPLGKIMDMLPGMSGLQIGDREEKKMRQTEAIILSMTRRERRQPQLINSSRRDRIAKGSGVRISEVNSLLKQFGQMKKMMTMMHGGRGRRMLKEMSAQMEKEGGPMPKFPSGKSGPGGRSA